VQPKYRASTRTDRSPEIGQKPLLLVDIDGVISLFARELPRAGASLGAPAWVDTGAVAGSLHSIDGIPHYLSATAAAHLLSLARVFELVWASGWEERADEHLPHLLGMPAGMPFLRFARGSGAGTSLDAHWKLDAVDAFAGERALAWVDDAFNPACHVWAQEREAPTLLVSTAPERGLTDAEAHQLQDWAAQL
jgi:hypothetical protein